MCIKESVYFLEGFALIRARAGPILALISPYGPEKSAKIRKRFALIWDFNGPVTLP